MKYSLLTAIVSVFFLGCDYNNIRTESELPIHISEYQIPDAGSVNQSVDLKFTLEATSGCFHDLKLAMKFLDDRNLLVSASATFDGRGAACPTNVVYRDTVVKFTPLLEGDYYFNVKLNSSATAKDTLHVK